MKVRHWAFLITGLLIFADVVINLALFLALRAEIPMLIEPIFNKRVNGPWIACLDELKDTEVRVEEAESANRWLTQQVTDLRIALNHDFSLLSGRDQIDRTIQRTVSKKSTIPLPAPKEKKIIAKR